MRPLLFVNWRRVSSQFTALMWMLACALAVLVLMHVPSGNTPAAASVQPSRLAASPMAPPTRLRH